MRPDRANARQPDLPDAVDRVAAVDRLLPQTQCRRCGYAGCLPYAEAMASGDAPINRCSPGGTAVVAALARLLDTAPIALDPTCGPTSARSVAWVDNSRCIGCTKCILACPVDAIVGAPRHQHHVLADHCTGCELCLPPCPVDCIVMKPLAQEWSAADAARGRRHHRARLDRLDRLNRQARAGRVQAADAPPGADAAAKAEAARDPLVVLGAPAERSRRLQQILERVRGTGRA
jgi:electron transport complex protein RnfB